MIILTIILKQNIHYKSRKNTFIYYRWNKRKLCNGTGKIDIKAKTFIITKKCDVSVEHTFIDYEEFKKLFKEKNIKIRIFL